MSLRAIKKFIAKNTGQYKLGIFVLIIGLLFFYNNCSEIRIGSNKQASTDTTPPPITPPPTSPPVSPSPTGTPVDLVNYSATPPAVPQIPGSGSWCNQVSYWPPTNVSTPINYGGTSYDLYIIGAAVGSCVNPFPISLDPLQQGVRYDIRTWTRLGIYSLRFKTPSFLSSSDWIYLQGGGAQHYGIRFSIARNPGEFHDDGRAATTDYCDGGVDSGMTSQHVMNYVVANDFDPGMTAATGFCHLLPNKVYYFNVVSLDPPPGGGSVNNIVFGASIGLFPIDCSAPNPMFRPPYCAYNPR